MPFRRFRQRGVILLLILGILFILSAVGVFYFTFSFSEVSLVRNYTFHLQAHFAATSGLEYAKEALLSWVHRAPFDPGQTHQLFTEKQGVSRVLNATGTTQEAYRLNISDDSSKLYLPRHNLSSFRLLKNLFSVLGLSSYASLSLKELQEKICQDGCPSISALTPDTLQSRLPPDVLERLRPYLARIDWLDNKVLRSIPESDRTLHPGQKVYSVLEWLPPSFEWEERSPVNINLASPIVLKAVLLNLSASYLQPNSDPEPLTFHEKTIPEKLDPSVLLRSAGLQKELFWLKRPSSHPPLLGTVEEVTLSSDQVEKIVRDILKYRTHNSFSSWEEWNRFCDDLTQDIQSPIRPAQADLLKAHANPNTDLNKVNPHPALAKKVDKWDITQNTTEWTFYPTGFFDVDSLGSVINTKTKEVQAKDKISATLHLYDLWRITTQKDFCEGDLGSVSTPQGGIASEKYISSILNKNRFSIQRSPSPQPSPRHGASSTQEGEGENQKPNAVGHREEKTLQIYPGVPLPGFRGCSFEGDGQIQLATLPSGLAVPHRSFYAGFNQETLDAQEAQGHPEWMDFSSKEHRLTQPRPASSQRLLFPDGAYSGAGHLLRYSAPKNFSTPSYQDLYGRPYNCQPYQKMDAFKETCGKALRGTLAFWIKPAFDVEHDQNIHVLFTLNRYDRDAGLFNSLVFIPQRWIEGLSGTRPAPIRTPLWGWNAFNVGLYLVAPFQGRSPLQTHEWTHIALSWDTTQIYPPIKGARIYINGEDRTLGLGINYYTALETAIMAAPDFVTHNTFSFGAPSDFPSWNFPAEATYDEITLSKDQRGSASIHNEYQIGRYYAGLKAVFTSPIKTGLVQPLFVQVTAYHLPKDFSLYLYLFDQQNQNASQQVLVNGWSPLLSSPLQGMKYQLVLRYEKSPQPLFSSPVVDDITIATEVPSNQQFLFYTED